MIVTVSRSYDKSAIALEFWRHAARAKLRWPLSLEPKLVGNTWADPLTVAQVLISLQRRLQKGQKLTSGFDLLGDF